jgi:hypothetical protein
LKHEKEQGRTVRRAGDYPRRRQWGLATADREWSGIKNSAIEQTKWLNSPEFRAVLEDGGTQIDFADYLKGVMSVYVCLPGAVFRHV